MSAGYGEETTSPAEAVASTQSGATSGGVPRFARLPVFIVAGVVAALLLGTSWRLGYFGDELYFIAAGQHPAWGYADQPPLLPLLARLMTTIAPDSLVVLRLPAVLVTAAGVVFAAMIARELGGERRAQLLTAVAYGASIELLGTGHLLATSTIDPFLWTVTTWLIVRWVRVRDDRLLLYAGLVTAVDLQVKYLIPIFWIALAGTVLVMGPRDMLRRPLLWLGLAVAVLTMVPSLLWQAHNGWPQLAMNSQVAAEVEAGYGGRLGFLPWALLGAGVLFGAVLLCYGLWRLLRSPDLRAYRFMAVASLVTAALFIAAEGRYYYVAGLYAVCWAAGAVEIQRHRPAVWWRWAVDWPTAAVSALVTVLLVLPILPPRSTDSGDLVSGGSVGWPELTDTVATAYLSLPADQRARTAVVTASYWQASALAKFGPARGLPTVYSPNRGFWFFGQPPAADTDALVIGPEAVGSQLSNLCTSVQAMTTAHYAGGVSGANTDVTVWHCVGIRQSWSSVWDQDRMS